MHIIYEAVSYTLETIDGVKCVCMDVEHVLRLYQRFDLRNFPVDTQTFDIELESRLDITRYHIVPLTSEKSPSVSVILDQAKPFMSASRMAGRTMSTLNSASSVKPRSSVARKRML